MNFLSSFSALQLIIKHVHSNDIHISLIILYHVSKETDYFARFKITLGAIKEKMIFDDQCFEIPIILICRPHGFA